VIPEASTWTRDQIDPAGPWSHRGIPGWRVNFGTDIADLMKSQDRSSY
jgi:hypothetical protein